MLTIFRNATPCSQSPKCDNHPRAMCIQRTPPSFCTAASWPPTSTVFTRVCTPYNSIRNRFVWIHYGGHNLKFWGLYPWVIQMTISCIWGTHGYRPPNIRLWPPQWIRANPLRFELYGVESTQVKYVRQTPQPNVMQKLGGIPMPVQACHKPSPHHNQCCVVYIVCAYHPTHQHMSQCNVHPAPHRPIVCISAE